MAPPVVFHPASGSHSVRLLQDGSRGESVLLLLESWSLREPGKVSKARQTPRTPPQAQLTLPGGTQASSSPWTLPIPKGKGQNPEPLLSVLRTLPANGGCGYQMTWLLTFARATFFSYSFYFLRPSHSTVQAGLKVSPCSPAWPRTHNSPFASASLVPGL